MKIPLQLLLDHVENVVGHIVNPSNNQPAITSKGWYQMQYWNPLWLDQEGVLLFGKKEDFPDSLEDQGIISVGKPSQTLLAHNDVLWFEEREEALAENALYFQLQQIMLRFSRLDDELNQILHMHGSLQQLTEKAYSFFENPILIHDQDFYQLAAAGLTEQDHQWDYDANIEQYRVPYDVINDFKINQDYLDTMQTRKTSIFPADTFGYQILYLNLWYYGEYRGRILIDETRRPLLPSDAYLLEVFAEIVKEYFRSSLYLRNMHNYQLSKLLQTMLTGEPTDESLLSTRLLYSGWAVQDDYFCACFFPLTNDFYTHAISYHCRQLSEKFPHSCVFEQEKHIVLLINASLSECSIQRFQSDIAIYLRDGLMKAGISSVGHDLNEFYYYHQQAIKAYETGLQQDPTFWSYPFDRYRSSFILHHALKVFPAHFLCCPELEILKKYDQEHGSQLMETLRCYLTHERALLKTAELLDIHRTTLLYRIRRIEELTGLVLEDEKVRFDLLMSFRLGAGI